MTHVPINDINEYERQKELLRARFLSEKTGEQMVYKEQSRLLKPLMNVQTETSKIIADKISSNENALTPFVRELQRRNDLEDTRRKLKAISPLQVESFKPIEPIYIDLDRNLNETDIENLQDLSMELPSKVYESNNAQEMLDRIKHSNKSIGQILGIGAAGKAASQKQKDIATSQKKYKEVQRDY